MKLYDGAVKNGERRVYVVTQGNRVPLQPVSMLPWRWGAVVGIREAHEISATAIAILADVLNERMTQAQLAEGTPLSVQLAAPFIAVFLEPAKRHGFLITEQMVWDWLEDFSVVQGRVRPTRDQLAERMRAVAG